jgi:LacI family transcriptional regulator
MGTPRLHDVAEHAGVSIATASLVLNGKGRISDSVKKKVFEAAKALGYKNNLYVPHTLRHKIHPLGILLLDDFSKAFEWHFVRNIITHIEKVITDKRYYPVLFPVQYESNTKQIMSEILTTKVKGLFSIHYTNKELFNRLEELGLPVVLVNNSDYQRDFFTVCTDDFQGAYEGTLHLLQLGHRDIVHVKYELPEISTFLTDSTIGFQKALDEYSIKLNEDRILTVDLYNHNDLERKIRHLFQSNGSVSAIYALDDYLAAKIIASLRTLSIDVPRDVSIIAAGDTLNYDDPFIPKISTMQVDIEAVGSLSGDLMLKRLNGMTKGLQVIKIKQHIVDRGSCSKHP